MAEAALFSVASKLLSTLASPAFELAYGKACSIWHARDEFRKLTNTIITIQAVLIDAEKKQSDSAAVSIWMKRVKDVLYDADDLFDEVTTNDMLRKQKKGNKEVQKVRLFFSELNPVLLNLSIVKRVKSIKESLQEISEDMNVFQFVVIRDDNQINRMREGRDPGSFVDSDSIIGREEEKKKIMEMLLHESNHHVRVIAIVGTGGVGKTTLSQLVYNDKEVEMNFENRWFASISDSYTDAEVYEKILQSIDEDFKGNSSVSIIQNKIKKSIEGKKCLIVLDDVWDGDRARWQDRINLLRKAAKGSKIIMSTRSESVARAMGASETHFLYGLSKEDSWKLFKNVVGWTEEYEKDQIRMILGRDIVMKCANIPLAIKFTASLLFEKDTIQEWESINSKKEPCFKNNPNYGVMSTLKLSYDYLPSNLKHCFAYCSLFPKSYKFDKDELIHLWYAQGYIPSVVENQVAKETGHSYFMDLLRRSFFQMDFGEYIMHDEVHDFAKHVAGEEIGLLSGTLTDNVIGKRHVSVGYVSHDPWEELNRVNRRRSFLLLDCPNSQLDQWIQFSNWKSLRALKLSGLKIEKIPSDIGELKYLRYLDISLNIFKELPDSITKLVNLLTLNISGCEQLGSLPKKFRKLTSLRQLYNEHCHMLKHLPDGFEELTCLQHLTEFRVCKRTDGGVRLQQLDGLSRLKLRGALDICFEDDTHDWDEIECWNPPPTLDELKIHLYLGIRIPNWGNEDLSSTPKLTSLQLWNCLSVKSLPSFKHIPNLRTLYLRGLEQLEYIEEDALFIPNLERLELFRLPKLKGWSRKECLVSTLAASLTHIDIVECPELSFNLPISETASSSNSSSSVEYLSFPGGSLTSLRKLRIFESKKLKKVELPPSHLNNLEELELMYCPELELWDENNRGVDWDSLPKLCILHLGSVPSSEGLPECLRRRQELGHLQIN